jgi:hypothetical protein
VIARLDGEVGVSVGVEGETAKPGPLRTLMQVHEELVRIRSGADASLPVWFTYYQRSVALYEQIAKIDPGHGQEAQYWAQREHTARKRSRPGSGRNDHARNDGARRAVKEGAGGFKRSN